MEPNFVVNGVVNTRLYSQSPDHYENMEQTIDWIKTWPNIQEQQSQSLVFLIDEHSNRGMLTASIAYPKRPTRRTRLLADRYNRVRTVDVGARVVRYFLSQNLNFTIVLSIGTFNHDTCLFMRKTANLYESVWFNPNRGTRVENVDNFLSNFNMASCKAYHSPDGNRYGYCSGYVWNAMTTFMRSNSRDPFDRNDLLVRNPTTKLYE